VLPSLEAVLVPAAYRGAFASYTTILIPALLGFALIQYALNPAFQLRRRTGPVVLAAGVALGVDAALLLALPASLGPKGVALAQLGGLACAAALFVVLAVRSGGLRLPWRDLALAAAATTAMAVAVLPLQNVEPPALALAASVAAGAIVYAVLSYALDLAGLRGFLRARATRLRGAPAPAE
jgi:O-antigen/teichoic acid export membrane protein